MANTIIRARLPLAATAGMKLFLYPEAGGAVANDPAGDVFTQVHASDPFFYETTVDEALAGNYQWAITIGANVHAAFGPDVVALADDAGPYELRSPSIVSTITAVATTVSSGEVSATRLHVYESAAKTWTFTVVDEDGNPINLLGKTVKLVVEAQDGVDTFVVTGTVSGANNNVVTVVTTSTHNATVGVSQWALRNTTDDGQLLGHGEYHIHDAALEG